MVVHRIIFSAQAPQTFSRTIQTLFLKKSRRSLLGLAESTILTKKAIKEWLVWNTEKYSRLVITSDQKARLRYTDHVFTIAKKWPKANVKRVPLCGLEIKMYDDELRSSCKRFRWNEKMRFATEFKSCNFLSSYSLSRSRTAEGALRPASHEAEHQQPEHGAAEVHRDWRWPGAPSLLREAHGRRGHGIMTIPLFETARLPPSLEEVNAN